MRRMLKAFPFIVACLALVGCATQSTSSIPSDMRVATADTVTQCRVLGDVHGVSGLYGMFAEKALAKCRAKAFQQARALGANTVVWQPFVPAYRLTSVSGTAYSCPP